MRDGLGSGDIDSSAAGRLPRAVDAPALQATVPDLEFAHTVLVLGCEPLDDAPILDLRIRKGVRRHGVALAIASARPSALDPSASVIARYAPGEEEAFVAGLAAELAGEPLSELAKLLRDGGEDVVILWGERIGPAAADSLLSIASSLGLSARDGAGLLSLPACANGRGLREAGAVPEAEARDAAAIAAAAADGSLSALYLFETDPVRDRPDRALWERAMHHAALVVAHASVLTEGLAEHANVIFPAESSAEKEGTVVHPDGRVQRLRAAIGHPGSVRSGWSVIASIALSVGCDLGVLTSSMAFSQLVDAVPFYRGLTLDAIAARGVRWPELPAAAAFGTAEAAPSPAPRSGDAPRLDNGSLRLGTYRPIWASPEVEISPSLKFLAARQQVELSPEDAARLELSNGETVEVAQNGTALQATVAVRTGVPVGTAFLAEGIAADSANAFTEPTVTVRAGR
jgi:NADH-quinone oxidoreductase subunit G